VELNQLKEELENCVEMQKFGEAAEIKAKVCYFLVVANQVLISTFLTSNS